MATEVSCGQCHGRLLVETLGVVVACPHCGTHLSIPAPEPTPQPVPTPEPAPVPPPAFSEPVPPEPAPQVHFEAVQPVEAPIPTQVASPGVVVVADQPNVAPEQPVFSVAAASDPVTASLHDGTDESQAVPTSVGWHSAPNLYLTPEVSASSTTISDPPVLFSTSPPEMPVVVPTPEPAVTFTAPAEPTPAPAPTWDFANNPAPVVDTPAAIPGFDPLAVTGPVTTVATPNTQPEPSATPDFQFSAPQTPQPTFPAQWPEPVPTTPTTPVNVFPQSLSFETAPATVAAPPATFATTPAEATPLTFGISPTPAASPAFGSAPSTAATALELPTSSAASGAAGLSESEAEARQKQLTMLLIIVGSYASAVTLILAYMLIFGRSSALESLPDLKPPMNKNGDISWQYSPPSNNVAPGHVLSLGQSQRFGNVKVTPLKVTRGPIKFEHYTGQAGDSRAPSEPVLKLWVKFENVSRNQTFAPLDPQLLFTRDVRNLGEITRANGFVTTEADRKKGKPLFFLFDIPVLSEFRIIGQNLNREVPPGQTFETFIPSEEDALTLNGDLVWRFQFRKGYNARSMRGVTTLIDVRFNSKDIVDERA